MTTAITFRVVRHTKYVHLQVYSMLKMQTTLSLYTRNFKSWL